MTPPWNDDVPKQITTGKKYNTTGKTFTLPDGNVSDIDLVGIAHQIESQERGFAYEQEEQLVREVELVTQNDHAAAEAAREEAEEEEVRAIEKEQIKKLKEANTRKKKMTKKQAIRKSGGGAVQNNDAADDDDEDGKGKSHGKNLSLTDKLMVSKAYIATSEDPIHGNKIGSAIFCDNLEENYRLLYLSHIEERRLLYNQQCRVSKCSNGTVPEPKEPPRTFCECPGQGIWKKFR
jgi:hypothetical protein